MNRELAWPTFRAEWIVYEDDDIIVVDKPVGISSQAADSSRPDDIVSRLKVHLEARDGAAVYLGVHQRLDRETSGILLFSKRREVNGSLAKQFEGRSVVKEYVAGVTGWKRGERATLRDHLAPGTGGRVDVVKPTDKRGQEAITTVKVGESNGERALLKLKLETGRTHQARVQLAHAGAPIAGDAVYGTSLASRLLLHALSLSIAHPTTGKPLRFAAPLPREFADWLEHGYRGEGIYDDDDLLTRAIVRAAERRYSLGRSGDTTAFRLINEEGDGLPGLAVDVYDDYAVAQLYGEDGPWSAEARRSRVLDAIFALGFSGIYLKVRPRQANTIVDARREEFAPKEPVRGTPAPESFAIFESGAPTLVRLADGLSTGIFLDQRSNRAKVRELVGGQNVLNLFAYTCGFSVSAALGGAWRTVSVDVSSNVLERGRENMIAAGVIDSGEHQFVADDVFAWIARARTKERPFDFVILDPPSYSTTKKSRFSSSNDYADLAAAVLQLVRPGGKLLACSNNRGISHQKFRRLMHDAARKANVEFSQMKEMPEPSDFPAPPGVELHLKSLLITRAR